MSDRSQSERLGAGAFRLETVWQDLRYAARQLRRNPGFALTATLTLSLGIGASTAVFSVAYGVLIDPFPCKDVDGLATPKLCSPELGGCGWPGYTPAQFNEIVQQTDIFNGVTASTISDVVITGGAEPERLRGNYITPNPFDGLGVLPVIGRSSRRDDVLPNHEPVALLSDRYWQAHYGGSDSILGQTLHVTGHPRTIVGVMPPRFLWRGGKVYLPIQMRSKSAVEGQRYFSLLGRLKPGVTEAQATSELKPIFQDFSRTEPRIFPQTLRVGILTFSQMFKSNLAGTLDLLLGVAAGLPLALIAGRFAEGELVETSQHDPLALMAAICILPLMAVAGTYLPARRAAHIDPVPAPRSDY